MDGKYEALRLKNQICFPLYAVSNLITRKYQPLLEKLDLTYTQYIVMMVLWEKGRANEKVLCEALSLKSNTLAPLLRKLRDKGYIERRTESRHHADPGGGKTARRGAPGTGVHRAGVLPLG